MFDTTADETATVMSNVVIVVINLNVWDEMGGGQHRLDIFDKYALHLKVFPLSVSGYTVQDISCGLTVT